MKTWAFKLFSVLTFCSALVSAQLRPVPSQFEFSIHDNQSGLQETDVALLFRIFEIEFGSQIPNVVVAVRSQFDWSKPYLGAGSSYQDGQFSILLWGGMVRARGMTFSSLAAILCHEVGHYLGGEPRQQFSHDEVAWSSAEGQSDHFAATVCLPRVYDHLKKIQQLSLQEAPESSLFKSCVKSSDPDRCVWVGTSGVRLVQFIQIYYDFDQPLADPQKKPLEKPLETLTTKYPSDQCRMETFLAGAVCDYGLACEPPRCWYLPPAP